MNEVDEMLKWEEHEELFNKNVLPRLEQLEKEQKEYRLQLGEVKNQVSSVSSEVKMVQASQGDLKNIVERQGTQSHELLREVIGSTLDIKKQIKLAETDSKTKISLKQLSAKEQIVLGIFGAGGLTGILMALPAIIEGFQNLFK